MEGWNKTWLGAKCYSCGCTIISGNNEFARETNHNKKDFSRLWKEDVKNKLYFKLRTIALNSS
jgi:hypothetical protein